MVKTIRKKTYDTETATVVKKVTSGCWGDPAGYEKTLYVTEDGSYFLYTYGGAESPYAEENIEAVSKVNAKKWLEENWGAKARLFSYSSSVWSGAVVSSSSAALPRKVPKKPEKPPFL